MKTVLTLILILVLLLTGHSIVESFKKSLTSHVEIVENSTSSL